jgi:hypothetical protein
MEPVKQTFPFKLYHTLEWASASEFSSALTWSASGHAFVVHDREGMVEHIIPHFFDHKKWRSFTRQLNLWGFKRELRGPNSLGETYYHRYFKRGKVEELQLIQRTEIKRRSLKKQLSDLSSSQQSSTVTSNHNHDFKIQGTDTKPQTGDITQGASFLTGLKGPPEALRANLVTGGGGGLSSAAYYGNMQGPGQIMSTMIPYTYNTSIVPEAASTHPQLLHSQMLQSQMMMHPQMMMRPQMFQGYQTGNWNPNNQLSREILNKIPTQQLVAMASNINGMNMNGYNMLQATDGARAVSDSSLNPSLLSTAPPQLDASNEGNTNEGASQSPSEPLLRAA